MVTVNLRPFLRPGLDVLFVALNAPAQSNANNHWFSGEQSRFYDLLYGGGLLIRHVPKSHGDDVVFGSHDANYRGAQYGVVDLVDDVVETQSSSVRASRDHVNALIKKIRDNEPRFVCVIHSKVRIALNKWAGFSRRLDYGMCGPILDGCSSNFVLNYFPNGNSLPDEQKLAIFGLLRNSL